MSYWSKDWKCCNEELSYKLKECPSCKKRRPHPTKDEAGPIDVTQEMIIEFSKQKQSEIKYDKGRDLYYFTIE